MKKELEDYEKAKKEYLTACTTLLKDLEDKYLNPTLETEETIKDFCVNIMWECDEDDWDTYKEKGFSKIRNVITKEAHNFENQIKYMTGQAYKSPQTLKALITESQEVTHDADNIINRISGSQPIQYNPNIYENLINKQNLLVKAKDAYKLALEEQEKSAAAQAVASQVVTPSSTLKKDDTEQAKELQLAAINTKNIEATKKILDKLLMLAKNIVTQDELKALLKSHNSLKKTDIRPETQNTLKNILNKTIKLCDKQATRIAFLSTIKLFELNDRKGLNDIVSQLKEIKGVVDNILKTSYIPSEIEGTARRK